MSNTILVPLDIDAMAAWLTNDTEKYDDSEPAVGPDGEDRWTIEPTEAVASDNHRHDDSDLFDRIKALLVKLAEGQAGR
jgi:hypothetical protein